MSILTNTFVGTVQVLEERPSNSDYNKSFNAVIAGPAPQDTSKAVRFNNFVSLSINARTAEFHNFVSGGFYEIVARMSVDKGQDGKQYLNLNVLSIVHHSVMTMGQENGGDIAVVFPVNKVILSGYTSYTKSGTTSNGNNYESFLINTGGLYVSNKVEKALTTRAGVNVTNWNPKGFQDGQYVQVTGSISRNSQGYWGVTADTVIPLHQVEYYNPQQQQTPPPQQTTSAPQQMSQQQQYGQAPQNPNFNQPQQAQPSGQAYGQSAPAMQGNGYNQGQGTMPPQNGYGQSQAPVQNPQYGQAPTSAPQTPDFSRPAPESTGFAGDNNPNVSTLGSTGAFNPSESPFSGGNPLDISDDDLPF